MPKVFICNDSSSRQGAEFFFPPDGQGGAVYPWCGEGQGMYGQWVDVSELGASGGSSGTTSGGSSSGVSFWDARMDIEQLSGLLGACALVLSTAYAVNLIVRTLRNKR